MAPEPAPPPPPPPPPSTVARCVETAVRAVDGVVDLDSGPLGTHVTYGSGGRVTGVAVRGQPPERQASIRLIVEWRPVMSVADAAMSAALLALSMTWPNEPPCTVDVEVVDIALPGAANGDEVPDGGRDGGPPVAAGAVAMSTAVMAPGVVGGADAVGPALSGGLGAPGLTPEGGRR